MLVVFRLRVYVVCAVASLYVCICVDVVFCVSCHGNSQTVSSPLMVQACRCTVVYAQLASEPRP